MSSPRAQPLQTYRTLCDKQTEYMAPALSPPIPHSRISTSDVVPSAVRKSRKYRPFDPFKSRLQTTRYYDRAYAEPDDFCDYYGAARNTLGRNTNAFEQDELRVGYPMGLAALIQLQILERIFRRLFLNKDVKASTISEL